MTKKFIITLISLFSVNTFAEGYESVNGSGEALVNNESVLEQINRENGIPHGPGGYATPINDYAGVLVLTALTIAGYIYHKKEKLSIKNK